MNRKQKKAFNTAQRKSAQKQKRVPHNLSGPERWALVDAITNHQGTKTKTQQAQTWQQVLNTGDKETVYTDAHGNKQIKIKSTRQIRKTY